jgi:hypothetical protein
MSQLSLLWTATICNIRIREKVLFSVGISPESLAVSCVASSTLGTRLFDLIPGSQVRRKRNSCRAEVNQAGSHLKKRKSFSIQEVDEQLSMLFLTSKLFPLFLNIYILRIRIRIFIYPFEPYIQGWDICLRRNYLKQQIAWSRSAHTGNNTFTPCSALERRYRGLMT